MRISLPSASYSFDTQRRRWDVKGKELGQCIDLILLCAIGKRTKFVAKARKHIVEAMLLAVRNDDIDEVKKRNEVGKAVDLKLLKGASVD